MTAKGISCLDEHVGPNLGPPRPDSIEVTNTCISARAASDVQHCHVLGGADWAWLALPRRLEALTARHETRSGRFAGPSSDARETNVCQVGGSVHDTVTNAPSLCQTRARAKLRQPAWSVLPWPRGCSPIHSQLLTSPDSGAEVNRVPTWHPRACYQSAPYGFMYPLTRHRSHLGGNLPSLAPPPGCVPSCPFGATGDVDRRGNTTPPRFRDRARRRTRSCRGLDGKATAATQSPPSTGCEMPSLLPAIRLHPHLLLFASLSPRRRSNGSCASSTGRFLGHAPVDCRGPIRACVCGRLGQRMATKSCMLVCRDAVTPMFSGLWLPSPHLSCMYVCIGRVGWRQDGGVSF